MLAKWNLFITVILLTFFTGLTEASNPLILNSIATQNTRGVLGVSSTLPSQVGQTQIIEQKYTLSPTPLAGNAAKYGKSRQINAVTWTIDVPKGDKSATAGEALSALNAYRQKNGRSALSWDSKLANYAQARASGFAAANALDGHAGFMDFVNNQDGFHKVGFGALGENSAIGFTVDGVRLIEEVYAGDKPHDDNQLSAKWSHVGIGISGSASDLVFGGSRL